MKRHKLLIGLAVVGAALLALTGCHKPEKAAKPAKSYPAQNVIIQSSKISINSARMQQMTIHGTKKANLDAKYFVKGDNRIAKVAFTQGKSTIHYWYKDNRMYARAKGMPKWVTTKVSDENQQALNQAASVTSLRTIWARLGHDKPALIDYRKDGSTTTLTLANNAKNRKAIMRLLNNGSENKRNLSYVYMQMQVDNNLNTPVRLVMNIKGMVNGKAVEEEQTVTGINKYGYLKVPKKIIKTAIKQK